MVNFNFLEKGLRLVSPPHLCMIFQEKCFSCYILITDQISLSDCLYFSRYWTICQCILQLFINQAVGLIFLVKPLWYLINKSRQKLKYLENEKSFLGEMKSNFHHFQTDFRCQKVFQTWECLFKAINQCQLLCRAFVKPN